MPDILKGCTEYMILVFPFVTFIVGGNVCSFQVNQLTEKGTSDTMFTVLSAWTARPSLSVILHNVYAYSFCFPGKLEIPILMSTASHTENTLGYHRVL